MGFNMGIQYVDIIYIYNIYTIPPFCPELNVGLQVGTPLESAMGLKTLCE
jgi:hypothetical protein